MINLALCLLCSRCLLSAFSTTNMETDFILSIVRKSNEFMELSSS
jgi:hypothetical protein